MHQADFIFIAPIPILYLVFAAQVWWFARDAKDSKAKRALRNLMLVFIGCSVSGYLFDMVAAPVWINNLAHGVVIVATALLVLTVQAKHIAKALDDA